MAKFSFGKGTPEDEGIPPEPVEGETTEVTVVQGLGDGGNRMRRWLMLGGVLVILIGGLYLANMLFFSAPPPPPVPARPSAPQPPAPVTPPQAATPQPPAKEAATTPAPAPGQPAKVEEKGPTKVPVQAIPSAKAPEPTKQAMPAKPSAEPPVKAQTAPRAKAAPEAPFPPKPAVSEKPAARAAKGNGKARTKVAAPAGTGFSVQVGAMAQQANADKLKKKLDDMGYNAVIVGTPKGGAGGAKVNVVTVGEPTGKREAEELARRLNVDGFPSEIVSIGGKYAPQLGSFVNVDDAIDMAREVQKKNYRPKITSTPGSTMTLFRVRHGQFDTRAAAVKRSQELKAKGFNGAIVVPN